MRLYDPAAERPLKKVDLDPTGRLLLVSFPVFDGGFAVYLERVKTLPGRRFDGETKQWEIPFSVPVLRQMEQLFPDFAVALAIRDKLNVLRAQEIAKHDLGAAIQPSWVKLALFPFQKAGVAALRGLAAALLGDEMGLGKTIQGIAWASAPDAEAPAAKGACPVCERGLYTLNAIEWAHGRMDPALAVSLCSEDAAKKVAVQKWGGKYHGTIVICPASVKLNWRREILRARPADRVVIVEAGNGGVPAPGAAEWVIINYDILTRYDRQLRDFGALSLIVDECHFIKNPKAKRTQAVLGLAAEIPRRLPMSGTPIMNRPQELFTILLMLGEKRTKEFFSYAMRYCAATNNGFGWDFSGASNLRELHGVIQPFFIRRLKQDVLPDLPPIIYSDDYVRLSPEFAEEYEKALDDFCTWYAEKGKDANGSEHLVQLTALRQLCVAGKVPALLERLDSYREEGQKALVFSSFVREGIDRVEKGLTRGEYVRLTGKESATDRAAAVDRFQNDPTVLFAICSTAAAGVGINLTAASAVFMLDRPWTPGEEAQAIARAHRIGQEAESILVSRLMADGTVDQTMADVLSEKASVVGAVLDGIDAGDAAGIVAREVSSRLAYGRG